MQILITNDDGIGSPGIYALAQAFAAEHDVYVVAPNGERSGASHSFTLSMPLRMQEVTLGELNVHAYAVQGTPVDCVKLGFGNLGIHPELLLSGVNLGSNLGSDAFYSGTVSAAIDGALLGIPAIALSVDAFSPRHFAPVIQAAKSALPCVLARECSVLNINAPDLPAESIKGTRFTACSKQEYENEYVECTNPRAEKFYWVPAGKLTRPEPDEDTDERWVREGYIAMVPITLDLTDYACLNAWRQGV